jgi:hypothetical protein
MPGFSSNGFQRTTTSWRSRTAWMAFSSRRLPTKHQGQTASETISTSIFMVFRLMPGQD